MSESKNIHKYHNDNIYSNCDNFVNLPNSPFILMSDIKFIENISQLAHQSTVLNNAISHNDVNTDQLAGKHNGSKLLK